MDFSQLAPAQLLPGVAARFAEAGPESVEPLARAMELRETSTIARRFETGRRCFVGRLSSEIVTYGWVSQCDESVGELERVYRMRPGEAYIWDCATLPGHRGEGLYGALLSHLTLTLDGEGVQRAWIGANLENQPSLRAFARVGFKPVVRVVYVRLLRLRCLWLLVQRSAPAGGRPKVPIVPQQTGFRTAVRDTGGVPPAGPRAPAELVDCARGMLTEPYEHAWRMLILGVRPRISAAPGTEP
jgi:GNAT superfamily N-acetyltransferase